jgi:hypothetical protein
MASSDLGLDGGHVAHFNVCLDKDNNHVKKTA